MAARNNKVSGSDYVLYMRAVGAPSTDNKMVMCQTDFSLNQSKNNTEEVSKCGRDSVAGIPTREATVSGFLAMPESVPTGQDYVDIKQLQGFFNTDVSYAFALVPKETATLSTGTLQAIDFTAKLNSLNTTWPAEGSATFETTLTLDDAPVYTDYAPEPEV
jgi:hypothetical protein